MSPSEQRLAELVDKWIGSVELHLRYASLSDAEYWKVQAWAPHQRPAPWILELARTRALELKTKIAGRAAAGDSAFADSLELMAFLASLVGVQDVQRHIPLAEPHAPPEPPPDPELLAEATITFAAPPPAPAVALPTTAATAASPAPAAIPPAAPAPTPEPAAAPILLFEAAPLRIDPPPPATPVATAPVTAAERADEPAAPAAADSALPAPDSLDGRIAADAVRLLKWGREWHELAPAIARISDRPGIVEVRKRLRAFKAAIEAAARE